MAYVNLPGVKASYEDGNFSVPTTQLQPRLLVIGPTTGGLTHQPWTVGTNVRAAEVEFGAENSVMKAVHESIGAGLTNTAVMRIGGRPSSIVLTDSFGETLTLIPEVRDSESLERYALVVENVSGQNRYLVWDLQDMQWIHDSLEEYVVNEGKIDVQDTGITAFTLSVSGDTTTYIRLQDLIVGDVVVTGLGSMATVTRALGDDGMHMSLVERYSALEAGYHLLDFRDADGVVPVDVFLDSPNLADGSTVVNPFHGGVPVAGSENDVLGYVWQFIYRGKPYIYFSDERGGPGSVPGAAATVTVNTDLVLTAVRDGAGGNNHAVSINASGVAGPSVVVSERPDGSLLVAVEDDGTATTTATVTAINLALAGFTTANGTPGDELLLASGGAATPLTNVAETPLVGGAGGSVLTHEDLTGDTPPAAVTARFAAATSSEWREVNFGHQLASFLNRASTTWKAMIGSISTQGPDSLTYQGVSDWVGDAPRYSTGPDGQQKIVDSPADNGFGLLGMKLIAGQSDALGGYRNDRIKNAISPTDGLAYGGFIRTNGKSLPNSSDHPDHQYGILDTDEMLDRNRAPVDIGKHIVGTYEFPVHRNGYNGGQAYRGPIAALALAKLLTVPENVELIGDAGAVGRVSGLPRIHATQLDQLAEQRMWGMRQIPGVGIVFTSGKTLAHPSSDWTRISTVRCANRILNGLRDVLRPFIGQSFSPERTLSMDSAMGRYLEAERVSGMHQGAKATLSFSRQDKIYGRIHVQLKMVPPFSIETITVNMSLAADDTEL